MKAVVSVAGHRDSTHVVFEIEVFGKIPKFFFFFLENLDIL